VARGAAPSRLTTKVIERVGTATQVIVKNLADGTKGEASLSELVRCLDEEGAIWYLAQQPVPQCLTRYLPKVPVAKAPGLLKPNLWLGAAKAHTALHHDHMHNLVVQLEGVKRFTIFAPQDSPYLARDTEGKRGVNYSRIHTPSEVDLAQFPEYRWSTPYIVELRPNDVFFMPAYWWHEVLTLKSALMLNYWWPATLRELRGVDLLTVLPTPDSARRLMVKHVNLSHLKSDHDLVDELISGHRQPLLAAVFLSALRDELLSELGAKHGLPPELLPETLEAVLLDRHHLSPDDAKVLKQMQIALTYAIAPLTPMKIKAQFDAAKWSAALRLLHDQHRVALTRRLIQNNALWLSDIQPNAYLS